MGLILFVASLIGLLHSLYMRRRNYQVCAFRIVLRRAIEVVSKIDEEQGRDWAWRLVVLESVSYDQMLHKFWKPLKIESFYPDSAFIMPPEIPDAE